MRVTGRAGPPTLSVVICAYTEQRWTDIVAAVDSIRAQSQPPLELILVVDHNGPLLDRARNVLAGPGLLVIPNSHPRGLSGARNTGTEASHGEIVVYLDDDARADPGWLAGLAAPYADPRVQGVGTAVHPDWDIGRPGWFPPEFGWVVGCSYPGLPTTVAPIRNPIGAAMSFRRSAFDAVGGFTDGIGRVGATPLGCEETEFAIRVGRSRPDAVVLYAPSATVRHRVTAQRTTWEYFRRRCFAEGLSKAVVSRRVGAGSALASERVYLRRTLPTALLRDLRRAGRRPRAAATVAGVMLTAAGYGRGLLTRRADDDHSPTAWTDGVWCGELDLSAAPAPPRTLAAEDGRGYRRARLLVRDDGIPVGFVDLSTPQAVLAEADVHTRATRMLADRIAAARADRDRPDPSTPVSVVVCTRDRSDQLPTCLTGLRRLRHPALEIVVVDNAPSDDRTREAFEREVGADPRFRYVREDAPGLSRARNRGWAEATGTLIAFTDDDVRVDPDWVAGLLRGLRRRPDVACVSGLVPAATLDSPAERYFDARVSWGTSCTPRVYDATPASGTSALHPFTAGLFGTGANFAVRADVLRRLGGFDPALGAGTPTHGGEDLDMFLRVLLAGHALAYEPSALVWHSHRADLDGLRRQIFGYGTGLAAYLTKHLADPRSRRQMAARIPAAVGHLRSLTRRGADGLAGAGPSPAAAPRLARTLRAREWAGLLAGPARYVRSRRAWRS